MRVQMFAERTRMRVQMFAERTRMSSDVCRED